MSSVDKWDSSRKTYSVRLRPEIIEEINKMDEEHEIGSKSETVEHCVEQAARSGKTKQLGARIDEAVLAKIDLIAAEYFDGNRTRALEFAITYTLDDLRNHNATRIEQQWIVHAE